MPLRQVSLVGMALPSQKEPHIDPLPSGKLTELVDLDPRHGVFPNLVMTPLMAVLCHLEAKERDELWLQIPGLLEDRSDRRFNALDVSTETHWSLTRPAKVKVAELDPATDLWFVFGIWPIAAIVEHLATGNTEFQPANLLGCLRVFLKAALQRANGYRELPMTVPRCKSPLPGILFRLCTDPDVAWSTACLCAGFDSVGAEKSQRIQLATKVRSMVPLPHNEAYDRYPFGKSQNCFMTCRDPKDAETFAPPPEVFWRYIGRIGATRARL
jgi:hypothetical protein